MKLTTAFSALLAITLAAGCVSPPEDKEGDPWCTGDECTTEPRDGVVKGLFVSGHLGNYMDCPGDGYSEASESRGGAGAPADADVAAGACAPGNECAPLNCEDAQVTIRLTNGGEATVDGLQIEKIELLDASGGQLAVLPLIGVDNTSQGGAFDGDIDAAEKLDLRVDFLGPENLHQMLPQNSTADGADQARGGDSAFIKLTISGDEHPDIIIDSDELYVLPSVVT